MIVVVFDTNVLISALKTPRGTCARIVELLFNDSRFEAIVSTATMREYTEVSQRVRLKLPKHASSEALIRIASGARYVSAGNRLAISADESDNRFLECAVSGWADYLITGNTKHFPERHGRTLVVKPASFLELFDAEGA